MTIAVEELSASKNTYKDLLHCLHPKTQRRGKDTQAWQHCLNRGQSQSQRHPPSSSPTLSATPATSTTAPQVLGRRLGQETKVGTCEHVTPTAGPTQTPTKAPTQTPTNTPTIEPVVDDNCFDAMDTKNHTGDCARNRDQLCSDPARSDKCRKTCKLCNVECIDKLDAKYGPGYCKVRKSICRHNRDFVKQCSLTCGACKKIFT